MNKNFKYFIIIASATFCLSSCNNENTDEQTDEEEPKTIEQQIELGKTSAQNVFNTLPEREKVLKILTDSKAEYDAALLNNPENAGGYTVENTEALNLGVFGTDLNVTNIFEQTQESILFLNCVNSLAKKLGVSNAFDETMMNRMDANKNNRDSTLKIISDSFKKTDEYLTTTNRVGASALIVAGAWIEGVYIACRVAKTTENSEAVQTIFEQKESMKNLIDLIKTSKANEKVTYLLDELLAIQTILEDKKDDKFTLQALRPLELKINALREKVITPN